MLWIGIAIAILCVLMCLILLPIEIRVKFHHLREDDGGEIELRYLFGLIRIKRELSHISAHPSRKGASISTSTSQSSSVSQGQGSTKDTEITHILAQVYDLLGRMRLSRRIFYQLLKHIHILKFRFDASVGVDDAVVTGVVVGTTHIFIDSLLGWLSYHTQLKTRPTIQVEPVYRGSAFNMQFESIIQVRLGYAISAVRKLLIVWKRRT